LRARTHAVVAPERGDVIAFLPPQQSAGNNVKRLFGIPGDTIETHDFVLFLNGLSWSEDRLRFSDPVDVYSFDPVFRSIPCPDALCAGTLVSAGAAPVMPCRDVSGLA
jgi:signal peptidase I